MKKVLMFSFVLNASHHLSYLFYMSSVYKLDPIFFYSVSRRGVRQPFLPTFSNARQKFHVIAFNFILALNCSYNFHARFPPWKLCVCLPVCLSFPLYFFYTETFYKPLSCRVRAIPVPSAAMSDDRG